MYTTVIKPVFDIVISIIALIIISPVFLGIIVCLFILNSGQPFFYHSRPGKNGRLFKVIKFKTMNNDVDKRGVLLPDAARLTPFGRFIRKTSLDEIPQFINVVKGEMSIVGPRPLLVEYLTLYNDEQKKRHNVKPGITGWAQVNGRNTISWQKRFYFDIWYVENISFLLDLKIILLTFKKVFISEGISSSTHATMEKFTGNN